MNPGCSRSTSVLRRENVRDGCEELTFWWENPLCSCLVQVPTYAIQSVSARAYCRRREGVLTCLDVVQTRNVPPPASRRSHLVELAVLYEHGCTSVPSSARYTGGRTEGDVLEMIPRKASYEGKTP
jgi:hypothetical protein